MASPIGVTAPRFRAKNEKLKIKKLTRKREAVTPMGDAMLQSGLTYLLYYLCHVVVAVVTTARHATAGHVQHAAEAAQTLAVGEGFLSAASPLRAVDAVPVVHASIPAADLSLVVTGIVAAAVSGGCLAVDNRLATTAHLGHVIVRRASAAGGRACIAVLHAALAAHARTVVVRFFPAAARVACARPHLFAAAHLRVVVDLLGAAAAAAPALVLAHGASAAQHALSLAGRQCPVAAEFLSIVVKLITTAARVVRSTAGIYRATTTDLGIV